MSNEVRVVPRAETHLIARSEDATHLTVTLRRGDEVLFETPHTLVGDGTVLRRAAHESVDATLGALTGRPGGFASTLVFARREGPRRKNVFRVGPDGQALAHVSSGPGVRMLPNLAHGEIWYSVLGGDGLFLTRADSNEEVVVGGPGLTMGVAPCEEGIAFSSSRDGDAEIYRAAADGTDPERVTYHPGIDVSPSCSSTGALAFVSNRSGRPQIHVLEASALHPDHVPQPPSENQTPTWCADPDRRLLAFTRVEHGTSVWTLDLDSGALTRISQPGRYKDPAFSPDCRVVAYGGRDGLWLASLDGRRRRRILQGPAETIAWGRLGPQN